MTTLTITVLSLASIGCLGLFWLLHRLDRRTPRLESIDYLPSARVVKQCREERRK